jgi:ribosomal protein S18 acetylase RimI-like enzyme
MSILSKDLVRNISLLGFFENYPLEEVFRVGNTFLLLGESDHLWGYISSQSYSELTELFKNNQIGTSYFASVEDWMKPIISEEAEVEWELTTLRYVLPENLNIVPPTKNIIALDSSFVDHIFRNSDYQAFTSKEYIKEQMRKGVSAGILEDNVLVAWGLTHDDGALGFLHVLPEFRGKGYGKAITSSLIHQKRKLNKPVFLNVEPSNMNSKNLVTKMGFVYDREISWVKLK